MPLTVFRKLTVDRRALPLLQELTRVNGNGFHPKPVGYVCPMEESKAIAFENAVQKLEDIRKDYRLHLEGVKVLSVEKRKHLLELVLNGKAKVLEQPPVVTISFPAGVGDKVLDFIRQKFWDKGNGIAVQLSYDNYAYPSDIKSNEDFFTIVKMEQAARAASQVKI